MPHGEHEVIGPSTSYEEMDFGTSANTPRAGLTEVGATPVQLPGVFNAQNPIVVNSEIAQAAQPQAPAQPGNGGIQTKQCVVADAQVVDQSLQANVPPPTGGGIFGAVCDVLSQSTREIAEHVAPDTQPETPQVAVAPENPQLETGGRVMQQGQLQEHVVNYTRDIPSGPTGMG